MHALNGIQKPLSKTTTEPLAINSTICPASWKTASKESPSHRFLITFSLNISGKEDLIISPGGPYHIAPPKVECALQNSVGIWSQIISCWEKATSQHRDLPPVTKCWSLPVATALILHMELIGTFSGTYPPNIRGCSRNLALQESSQEVVFDEVTMTKFSLALLARQKHPQMRWLPVACEAARPLLQFWGYVTNQVIALGKVHPLHPLQRPPFPAHLGGKGVGGEGKGGNAGPQTS